MDYGLRHGCGSYVTDPDLEVLKAMLLYLCLALQDVETIECDSTQGWVVTDFGGGVPKGASLTAP